MGSDFSNEYDGPAHPVNLDGFWIYESEVTNAMYRKCKEAGICTGPGGLASNTVMDYFQNPEYDQYPVINVIFDDAATYCKWAGVDLPSEAQWEKAARGTDGRTYPWGQIMDNSKLNYNNLIGDTNKVKSFSSGASPYGVLDMAGNVAEWTRSLLNRYPYVADDGREDTSSGIGIAIRGGGWNSDAAQVSTFMRWKAGADYFDHSLGFRCAKWP